jgi:alpha-mannosidase
MNETESALRRSLSIPDDASQVLVFEQSAHCDWDWVATFQQYYACGGGEHQAVSTTLQQALASIDSTSGYQYVYCEVAYLQAFMNDPNVPQSAKDALTANAGSSFLFSSGGITSAENLTLHTEAFIRNYLLGRQWLSDTFGSTASNQMWIPDDFGHDAQLPVLLQAMGFTGAGFWRIPAQAGAPGIGCVNPTSNAASFFLDQSIGLDFTWQANDQSQIQAHWLSNSYCEGNGLGDYGGSAGGGEIQPDEQNAQITAFIAAQSTTAIPAPPYMFVPIDCDFTAPYTNLPAVMTQWNRKPPIPGVYVVMASFDYFMQLVAAAGTPPVISPSNANYPFIPHPYYSGCYGSKPFLKTTHYQTARTLLFSETMQLVLQAIGSSAAPPALINLAQAWNDLAPSTHHDYITGTAPNTAQPTNNCPSDPTDDVYDGEQVPVLQQALTAAQAVQSDILGAIAGAMPAGDGSVVVFNPLGFERIAIADLAAPPAGSFQSSTADSQNFAPVQDDGNGGLLLFATPPSLGYTTVTLSTTPPNQTNTGLSASQPDANGPVVMTNDFISAVIDTTGITSLTDPNDGSGTNYLGGTAGLVFYKDGGNIYRFAMEIPCDGFLPFHADENMQIENPTITLTETGDLRATAIVTGTINGTPWSITYQLYATDRAVRITVTGAAPSVYSVMWRFPFASAATALTYGTTAHWDTQAPRTYFDWTPPKKTEVMTFEPTHEFVGVVGNDDYLGAIYQYATPGWAIDNSGAVIGCLLRNTPGEGTNAASGSDDDSHTVSFAVAVPGQLQSPANGAWGYSSMLATALDLNNPAAALAIPASATGALPPSMSIASTTDERALVTVAKAGTVNPSQMILRLYQPTNGALSGVEVTLDPTIASLYQSGGALAASAVNALEQPSDANLNISTNATTVTLDLPFAITTVALG